MPARHVCRSALLALAGLLIGAPAAAAAPVLSLSADGGARVVRESFAAPEPAVPLPPPPRAGGALAAAGSASAGHRSGRASATPRRRGPTVRGELRRMLRRAEIDRVQYAARLATYDRARRLARGLSGRGAAEMRGVVSVIDTLTAGRQLRASRLAPLWLTLERNGQWWSDGPIPAPGQRVTFDGSETVWQYVPGYGVQLHPLANFGRLNALWQGGRRYDQRLARLLDELLAVRVERAGGVAWEYYFPFGPAQPPWVSGMAQATGLQAFARASARLSRQDEVLPIARGGLSIFEHRPPEGVSVPSQQGAHYLLYSGDPELRVVNGFVQALGGLHEFAARTGDARASALYTAGRNELASELAHADTGAWSLYALGRVSQEANLHYHKLLSGFLEKLCGRTGDPLYCETHGRFTGYAAEPPRVKVRTRRLRAGRAGRVRFELSKRSSVKLTIARGKRLEHSRHLGTLAYGRRWATFTPPRRRPGAYSVTLEATGPAGNSATTSAPLEVLPARKRRSRDR